MKRLYATAAIVAGAALSLPVAAAHAGARVALVIGESAYRNEPALTNPALDATAVRDALVRANYDVDLKLNLGVRDLRAALVTFQDKARGADVAILYYAGHGLEMNGKNYLIPVDAALRSDQDIDHEAVDETTAMAAAGGAANLSLVILDACRNNPFLATMQMTAGGQAHRGLAPPSVDVMAPNQLVEYAAKSGEEASDGQGGAHSPFAKALITHLTESGVDVDRVFGKVRDDVWRDVGTYGDGTHRQTPFKYGTTGGDPIYLVSSGAVQAPRPPRPPPPPLAADPAGPERLAWSQAQEGGDAPHYRQYLQQFPSGDHAANAQDKLNELDAQNGQRRSLEATSVAPAGAVDPLAPARAAYLAKDYTNSLQLYSQAATNGEVVAMNWVGYMLANGQGAAQDFPHALTIYLQAAKRGSLFALNQIGVMVENGRGVPQDYQQARQAFSAAADKGYAAAQYNLGGMLERGLGLPKNSAGAIQLYQLAANQGYADAAYRLGQIAQYGSAPGDVKDYAGALTWYRKAAASGHAAATSQVGYFYDAGLAVPVDKAMAFKWYLAAAQKGNAIAQNNVANMIKDGIGTPQKDPVEALKWRTLSADQGNARAQYALAWACQNGQGTDIDYSRAMYYYQKAESQHYLQAAVQVGYLYEYGLGVDKDYSKAFQWYSLDAKNGVAVAESNLGLLYLNGRGVDRDYDLARQWFLSAAAQGYATAQSFLGLIYDQGRGVTRDQAQARVWMTKAAAQGDARAQAWLSLNPG